MGRTAPQQAHGICRIGRYGDWTYCAIEDNIVQGENSQNSYHKKAFTFVSVKPFRLFLMTEAPH